MIVACAQCHTRFKVPDRKVKARGLKVRCSRCGHTFRIFPDSASELAGAGEAAAPRPRAPDPFEAFGPDGTSEMEKTPERGTTVSALLARLSPLPAVEDFDVDVSGEDASPSTEPAWNFPPAPDRPARTGGAAVALQNEPPAPVAEAFEVAQPESAAGPPRTHRSPLPVRPLPSSPGRALPDGADEPAGFGLVGLPPVPSPPAPSTPAGNPPSVAALAGPPVDAAPVVSAGAAPGSSPRPEDLAALAGFTPAWGVAAPVRAISVDGTVSSHVPDLSPAPDPEPLPPQPQFSGPEPQFGVAGTVLDDLPSLDDAAPLSGDPVELDPGSDIRAWTGASHAGHGGMQIELEPNLAPVELDRRPPPAPTPDPAWALAAGGAPKVATPAASGLAWDDPFSEPPAPPPSPPVPAPAEPAIIAARSAPPLTSVVLDDAPVPGRSLAERELFDIPDASGAPSGGAEPTASLLPDVPDSVEPVATAITGPLALGQISKPPTRTRLGLRERELPGTARRISGVVLNVGLAALLLLVVVGLASSWATAGRLEGAALSPRRLLQAFRAGTGVTPVEVTPGTYETRSGRSLLYVRGRVLNRGAPASRVRIRAELWDGAQAVKSGETLAGAIASPEDLWRAATPADVEALRTHLLAGATRVADGQQADFLVLLDEAPRDLAGLRLRVSAAVER